MHHIFCGQQMPASFPVAAEIWIPGKITIQIRYICPDFRQYFFMKPPKKVRKEDARCMGIVEAIQKYRQYEDADPKIRDLMDKLRKFEEHNMEKLKDFLWKSYSAKLPASADTL